MTASHYDYFVIGAGSGGVRSARIAASHGAKVGIAEGRALGGTCVNAGCVPKKLMAYAADFSLAFEDAENYGWRGAGKPVFDWPAFISRKNAEIERLNGIYGNILKQNGVTLHRGFARFTDAHTLDIGGETVTADKILIATGGRARRPAIPGGDLMAVSDDIFHLKAQPETVLILGGGYIAVEFSHIFSGMGAKVIQLYRGGVFLRGFDNDLRRGLAEEMRKGGIDLRFNCDAARVEKTQNGLLVHIDDGHIIPCDLALAAIGRAPETGGLNLNAAGVKTEKDGRIKINGEYQSTVPHIYAVGDVANRYPLTPVAIAEGHALADRLFGRQKDRRVNYANIPTAVFSHPPIATAGLSAEQALEQGHDILCYKTTFRPLKHTISGREEKTLMKLVADAQTDKILGVHMLGLDAPEILQGFAVALNAGATKADFDRTIAIHPTSAEEFVLMRTPETTA